MGTEQSRAERNGMERNRMEWNGTEWNGTEWNGAEGIGTEQLHIVPFFVSLFSFHLLERNYVILRVPLWMSLLSGALFRTDRCGEERLCPCVNGI